MKFIYGKQDFQTLERGEENCFLMTNGLGGFSSLTMTGSCSRNDHAVLMACVHAPNNRVNMIHRLEEELCIGEKSVHISSQRFADGSAEEGFLYQTRFVYEDYPQFGYLVEGVEIVRTLVMKQGENTVGVSYEMKNRSNEDAALTVYPHLQFVPKGALLSKEQLFTVEGRKVSADGKQLYCATNGEFAELPLRFCDNLYYAYDACDGRRETGCTAVNHCIRLTVPAGKTDTLCIVYGMAEKLPSVAEMLQCVKQRRRALEKQAGFTDETAKTLAVNADRFISYRASTAKQTILAGFPFFEDWGRDTMIAVQGLCLATRRYEEAKSILQTFLTYCKKGLMPNLFPEGKEAPGYNTVDASLLFILAVYEYYKRTKDTAFVRSAYGTMAEIIEWYKKGTDFGIGMDADGLITAGKDLDQVTWMDVRVGDILPTPRHGKPVEINAYWYNALRIMEEFQCFCSGQKAGQKKETVAESAAEQEGRAAQEGGVEQEDRAAQEGRVEQEGRAAWEGGVEQEGGTVQEWDYGRLAALVKESFAKFWNAEAGCLKDVLSGTKADMQIRCNQIWAVSLPFSVLLPEREKQVVETVFRKLYTPYGLRTLDPADEEFCPVYGGEQLKRDLAYHQGTVWVFPLGGYYLAYLKVNGYSEEAKAYVKEQLESMDAALREGCIGQLPEIYDGAVPVSSKGCFAQAWSVGEILRVYDALRVEA
ncbi:MAG: amylo-alpha-1,6-glucosidase [Lachnospiraceae bacterium]|nr:amylo-alpha-1,6-glucosidase [Lachnospiraceae bacterium]